MGKPTSTFSFLKQPPLQPYRPLDYSNQPKANTETHLWKDSHFLNKTNFAWDESAAFGLKETQKVLRLALVEEAIRPPDGEPDKTPPFGPTASLAVKKRSNSRANLALTDSTRSAQVAAATNLSGGAGYHSVNF